MLKLLTALWDPASENVQLSKKDNIIHKRDATNILKSFGTMFDTKLKTLMQDERLGIKTMHGILLDLNYLSMKSLIKNLD
jgi:hypothetical protein